VKKTIHYIKNSLIKERFNRYGYKYGINSNRLSVNPLGDGMNPMNATKWEFKYFLFPFIAHAIGTLSGAFIAAKFSASYHMVLAVCIGIFFLQGGISMVFIMPAPVWFIVADLSLAYIPMGGFGWKISGQNK